MRISVLKTYGIQVFSDFPFYMHHQHTWEIRSTCEEIAYVCCYHGVMSVGMCSSVILQTCYKQTMSWQNMLSRMASLHRSDLLYLRVNNNSRRLYCSCRIKGTLHPVNRHAPITRPNIIKQKSNRQFPARTNYPSGRYPPSQHTNIKMTRVPSICHCYLINVI